MFLFGKVADKNAWFHAFEYTTFRLTFLENALGSYYFPFFEKLLARHPFRMIWSKLEAVRNSLL